MRKLTSDELGEKGEHRFGELCADGAMICNRVSRDRTGWDFFVQIPFSSEEGNKSLDKRDGHIDCLVQVKTLWADRSTFRIRLSSAERLAKSLLPTFICVLSVTDDLSFSGVSIFHVLEDKLAKILGKLRQRQAEGRLDINHAFVEYKISEADKVISVSGQELRTTLESFCGQSGKIYSDVKMEQLKNIGFEKIRVSLETKIKASGIEDIIEGFLGRKKLSVSHLKATEVRFGIGLPIDDLDQYSGEILINPHPIDKCLIHIVTDDIKYNLIVPANIFVPAIPNLKIENFRALVKSKLFVILLSQEWMTLESNADFGHDREVIIDWIDYFKFMKAIAEGKGFLSIKSSRFVSETPIPLRNFEGSGESGYYRYLIDVFRRANELLTAVVENNISVRFKDITNIFGSILYAHNVIFEPQSLNNFSITMSLEIDGYEPKEEEFLCFSYLSIGDLPLAYCFRALMEPTSSGEDIIWISKKSRSGYIEKLSSDEDFGKFVSERTESLDNIIFYIFDSPDSFRREDGGFAEQAVRKALHKQEPDHE